MELNEIKKALYNEKPTAKEVDLHEGFKYYYTHLKSSAEIVFKIPLAEVTDSFTEEVQAHLLIRHIELDRCIA